MDKSFLVSEEIQKINTKQGRLEVVCFCFPPIFVHFCLFLISEVLKTHFWMALIPKIQNLKKLDAINTIKPCVYNFKLVRRILDKNFEQTCSNHDFSVNPIQGCTNSSRNSSSNSNVNR